MKIVNFPEINFNSRLLVGAPKNAEELNRRFAKTRLIEYSMYAPMDIFYYWNRTGKMRTVNMDDGSIWTSVDEDPMLIRRIR